MNYRPIFEYRRYDVIIAKANISRCNNLYYRGRGEGQFDKYLENRTVSRRRCRV